MKNLFRVSLLALAIVFTSCSDDDDNQTLPVETNTIVDIVAGNPDFSTLGSALAITNLTSVLASEGPFTVFAPTNDAFADFLTANGFATLEDVPVEALASTLLNHVVGGAVNAADLSTGYINTSATFNGEADAPLSMYVNTSE
ncbi:MAG: fasciclin domain-containing protein, partial [Ulvibacter sp.]|nr:fasciclin domain-containing protein [Ulvibacter sp.]